VRRLFATDEPKSGEFAGVLEGGASRDRTGDLLLAKSAQPFSAAGWIQVCLVNPGSPARLRIV
jgi:hypothetical protein